jgi:hypothetical protein
MAVVSLGGERTSSPRLLVFRFFVEGESGRLALLGRAPLARYPRFALLFRSCRWNRGYASRKALGLWTLNFILSAPRPKYLPPLLFKKRL